MLTQVSGGRIIDPAWQLDEIAELWIEGDQIIAIDPQRQPDRVIDAQGCVVMAGGIDLHTHIGGGKVTLARLLLADQMPDITPAESDFLPAAAATGRRYLEMGYTTCFEPAVIPCNARAAHAEMADVVGLDTGSYCLLGNDEVLLRMIAAQAPQPLINDYVAWMVRATQSIAVKVVNAGGIDAFKFGVRELDVDTPHPSYGVTPAAVIRVLCRSVHEIGLAHPLHVHCSNLGVPGNIESTLATIRAADGLPIHLTHAQFHSYGSDGPYGMSSAAARLVAAMTEYPNVTIDVGQVMFGQTVTISADSMHQHANRVHARPRKSALVDIECEAGCGVVPFRYRRRHFVHSLQWAIGLELFLLVDDPSRVFLTTDHPNGGPFTTYPHLIGLLSDRSLRETALAEIHPEAAASSQLKGLTREYSLAEIATMTRDAPARILGLRDRGHLAPGAVADVAIYREQPNRERMFAEPVAVIRRGECVVGDGAVRPESIDAPTNAADVDADQRSMRKIWDQYGADGSAASKLWISDDELADVIGSNVIRHASGSRTR